MRSSTMKVYFPLWHSCFSRGSFHCLLVLIMGILCTGCEGVGVKIRVTPLVAEEYSAKPQGAVVDELNTAPTRSYVKIAKLVATSQTADEETVRGKVVKRAGSLGADAVIINKVDVLKHMGHPRYQSTMDPSVMHTIFTGGPGSGFPMFFDPWTYSMTSQDGTTWTLFVSGVAIRYVDAGA